MIRNAYLYVGLVFLLSLFTVAVSHAQPNAAYFSPSSSDTAIITTGVNSIDTFSSYPLASFYGLPVISLNSSTISSEVVANLTANGIKNVIVVGGPAVISNQTIEALQNAGFNVLRIYGITAPDTALDLADYFLPSANVSCAVLVPYNENSTYYYTYQFAGSIYSARNRCVLFPLYFGNVPLPILSYLSQHNIRNISFFGPVGLLPAIKSQVNKSVAVVGVQENESYLPPHEKVVRYLIVGVNQNAWQASMVIGSLPSLNSSMALVSNVTAQMPGIVNYIKRNNITDVRVVGIPSIVAQIESYLSASNITYESEPSKGAAFSLVKQFHNQFSQESDLHDALMNISRELQSVRAQLSNIINKLSYYNLSIYNASIGNSSALNLSSKLDSLLSLVKNASASISSNNVSYALSLIAQINSGLNSDLYESYMHGALVNSSSFENRLNQSQVAKEIGDEASDQVENIGRFISNSAINATCKARIGSVLNFTSAEIKNLTAEESIDAASGNMSGVISISNKIREIAVQNSMLIRGCEMNFRGIEHRIGGVANGSIGNYSVGDIIKIINSSDDNLPHLPGIGS
ncbi:MAG: hypothetical protein OH316_00515 [Candidatus Parvarchaeota archaeon]|nr:hypothetical protein [Candidatus Parvarchaeota archaeon]